MKRDVFSMFLHATVRNGKPLKQTPQGNNCTPPLDHELTFWAWRQRFYHGEIKDGGQQEQIDLINLPALFFSRYASQKTAGMPQPTLLEVVTGVAGRGEAEKLKATVHLREGKRNKLQTYHKSYIYVFCLYIEEKRLIKQEQD